MVQPFLSAPGGNLQVSADGTMVVVSDRAANVERIEQIIELLDRAPAEVVLEPVAVKNGSAVRRTPEPGLLETPGSVPA